MEPAVGQLHTLRQPLCIEPRAVHEGHHVERDAPLKEPSIIAPPLHHQGKTRQLRRPPVDVETEEVSQGSTGVCRGGGSRAPGR